MKKIRDAAIVYINGQEHAISGESAFMMAADYLRTRCSLVGTKIVCAEGDCGACTVLRASHASAESGEGEFEAINACIVMMAQLDGCELITVEGLAPRGQLSAVQDAVARCHGSQCGYCTPGFVMAITACIEQSPPSLDEQTAKNYLTGNLCRCTGYAPLIEATLSVDRTQHQALSKRDAAIPLALKAVRKTALDISSGTQRFLAPLRMEEAVRLKRRHPAIRIVGAATDVGVHINKGNQAAQTFLSLHLIPQLYRVRKLSHSISCGARVSLARLRRSCEEELPEFSRFLNIFASPQIKNMATLVGNIANASPIGDSLPFLLVNEAFVHIEGAKGSRKLAMGELYRGYRQLALKSDELISAVIIKRPRAGEFLRLYKVSQRRDLDISTVSGAFAFRLDPAVSGLGTIKDARIALGGVGPTALRCRLAEDYLQGQVLSDTVLKQAIELVQQEISPLSDLRASAAYRRVLVAQLFERYALELRQQLLPAKNAMIQRGREL